MLYCIINIIRVLYVLLQSGIGAAGWCLLPWRLSLSS